jgi:phosphoglycolate phosphatase
MLEQILAHCGVRAEQALMVGDSSFDLLMARNAGMNSVAVSYGAQSIESLQQFEPRLSIDRFCELHAWLEQQA